MPVQPEFVAMSMFVLGLRHGFDWDHLAALADLAGAQDNTRCGFLLCLLYAVGHAAVVLSLGFLAVRMGAMLPPDIDACMEPLVGVTLIVLSIALVAAMLRHGTSFKLTSRYAMLAQIFWQSRRHGANEKVAGAGAQTTPALGALLTGAIHGIGAETPTQILALLAAASAAQGWLAAWFVGAFVTGIFISNLAVATLLLKGYDCTRNKRWLNLSLGVVTAVFSLAIGIAFLTKSAAALPVLTGN